MQELEQLCREVWAAYEYMRDNDLSGESGTSKRLRSGETARLRARLLEELAELRGVVEGTHRHEGFDRDIVLEGYEVWYWGACLGVAQRLPYEALAPHRAFQSGYEAGATSREALLSAFDELTSDPDLAGPLPTSESLARVFYLVGRACSLNGTSPARLLERDRAEMRQKTYLAAYWQAFL